MQFQDYYQILGVKRDTSAEEIAKSYKRLARKYHPDLNKEKGAEDKFKQLNEAYEVLKDPTTRQRYDQLGSRYAHGSNFQAPPEWANFGGGGMNFGGAGGGAGGFSDFFETFFSGIGRKTRRAGRSMHFDDVFSQPTAGPTPRGRDVQSKVTVELEDIHHGRKRTISLKGPDGPRRYDVTIPKWVRSGEKIRLKGQGEKGPYGAGDLLLTITIAPHPLFKQEKDDLVFTLEIPPWDAALGAQVPIPTLDGEVTLTLPAGQSSGQRLRLKGKGLPKKGGKRGNLYAELKITVPNPLTEEQRRLFEELREAALEPVS
jgi:curved DNA-binding protein